MTPAQQHLGKLRQFEKKNFSFTLKNQGSEPIRILSVEHSCGCTEAKASQDHLAPGQEAQIVGSLDPQNRVGEFGSQITLSFSQEGRQDLEVKQSNMLVGARAVTLINMPAHLDLGSTVLGREPVRSTFEVTKGDAETRWNELRVLPVQSKVTVSKLKEDKWQVSVTAIKEEIIGSSREDLVLELLNSKSPGTAVSKQTLPLSWKTVSENFSVSPQGVYLSGDRVGKVKVKSLNGRPVEITRIDIPQDAPVRVKQVKVKGQLHLEFQNFQAKGKPNNQDPWSGKIQVTLSDRRVEEGCRIVITKN